MIENVVEDEVMKKVFVDICNYYNTDSEKAIDEFSKNRMKV